MAVAIPGASQITRRLKGLRRVASRHEGEELLLSEHRDGHFAESFRLLALNVHQLLEDHPSKALVVLSAYDGDGRTTVAANLAIALGRYGRVLLADSQADFFRERGWLQDAILSGDGSRRDGLPEGMRGLALETAHEEVWFMHPGERVLGPSSGLSETIRKAGAADMYTIIDSPPARASSEAFRVAQQAGKVLYVIRRKPQDMEVHRQIRDTLARLGADIIGLVVNEF